MNDVKILSTGVLAKNNTTNFALITLVNLDPNDRRRVVVEVFRWDTGSPTPIATNPPNPIVLNAMTSVRVTANLANTNFYEVRIHHPGDRDVIVNCFGVSTLTPPAINGEGNTVLQDDLVEVSLK